jgi:glucose/arabinose dehydrogenase
MHRTRLLRIAALGLLLGSGRAWAKPLNATFTETVFVPPDGLDGATSMAWAPDGSNRLFVATQGGAVRIVKDGVLLPTPFATVQPVLNQGETGLVGIALHPDFVHDPYVYLFATVSSSEQQIIRYTASGDSGVEKTTLVGGLPTRGANHDGGAIGVGPDGKLYWAIGDQGNGTGTNDDLATLAAKVGRANLDGTVPADNPFVDGAGPNADFIWARGFRNPFTFTFQPTTGLLWLNVVGAGYEQVFVVRRGDHGGWDRYESNQPPGFLAPVISYPSHGDHNLEILPAGMNGAVRAAGTVTFRTARPHGFRQGEKIIVTGVADPSFNRDVFVSTVPGPTSFTALQAGPDQQSGGGLANTLIQGSCLTGGTFYDATQFPPDYRGDFFYGDFASGRIMRATLDARTNGVTSADIWATDIPSPVDLAVGPDGALYYLGHGGWVFRTSYRPQYQGLVVTPTNLWATEGKTAVVSVRLAQAISADATVSVARLAGDTDVTVASGSTLTFTASNWQIPQAVTVAVAADGDADDELATLAVTSTVAARETVAVHVRDVGARPAAPGPDGGAGGGEDAAVDGPAPADAEADRPADTGPAADGGDGGLVDERQAGSEGGADALAVDAGARDLPPSSADAGSGADAASDGGGGDAATADADVLDGGQDVSGPGAIAAGGGCGCRVAAAGGDGRGALAIVLAFVLAGKRRFWRRRRRPGSP